MYEKQQNNKTTKQQNNKTNNYIEKCLHNIISIYIYENYTSIFGNFNKIWKKYVYGTIVYDNKYGFAELYKL